MKSFIRCAFIIIVFTISSEASAAETRILVPVTHGPALIGNTYLLSSTDNDIDNIRIEAAGLQPWAAATLSPAMQEKFNALIDSDGTFAIGDTEPAGFTLSLDQTDMALRVEMRPEALKTQSVSLQHVALSPSQTLLPPASMSAFVNLRGGVDYVHESLSAEGRQPLRLDTDGAINIKDWVLEGRAAYQENADSPWARDNMRLVHDWPEMMVRMAVGDLSYPVSGFQSYQPLLGVSIARNFDLQPYLVTAPTGQTSFTIRSPSRVDVLINGQRVRTLQLDPGPYDMADFPVADGSNDVTLIITDATGNREVKRFSLLSNQRLLKEGLHEYAYNIGIESDMINRRIEYETDNPALSFFHRYGLTETMTTGMAAQGNDMVQQLGLSGINAFSWGVIGIDTGFSHMQGFDYDMAAELSYSYEDSQHNRQFSAALQYSGQNFAALGQTAPSVPTQWEAGMRYSQGIAYDINMGIGGLYRIGHEDMQDDWSYNINFSKVLNSSLSLNLNIDHRHIDGAGMFVSLSWSPPLSRHMVSTSIDTLARRRDARWDWYDGNRMQAGMGVTHDGREDSINGTGNFNYTGYRGEMGVRHDITSYTSADDTARSLNRNDERSQLQFGSALAYADGHVALSRPISSSFIMLPRHKNLRGQTVGVNPETRDEDDTAYQAEIDGLGPAVLADTQPYIYRAIKIDTGQLPLGYDIGQDNFIAMPHYKGGSVMVVGNAANIYADGYMHGANGTPLSLQSGIIRSISDDQFPEQEFFTNAKGRFRITRLQPGDYIITLATHPHAPLELTIPDDITGKFDAGTLIVQEETIQ